MKKFVVTVCACFIFLLIIPLISQASPLVYSTERIFGQDRVETSISIAQKGWSSAQAVILCEGEDYPDSIAAAPFASSLDAPVLLTGGKTLDPRVITELQRLKPQKIILLGGTGCLTPAIETQLTALGFNWERIGGQNRYETSVLLAGKVSSDSLIIANGDNFPDALSAASYAGIKQIPVVLTSKTMPSSVAEYCQRTNPAHIIVIGGEGAVSTESLTKSNLTIETRLGGKDRFETNAKVIDYMKNAIQSNDQFFVSGINFPDAVAGTVMAAKLKAPLYLAEKEDIPPAVYSLMRQHMKVEPSPAKTPGSQGTITASGGLNLRDTPSISGESLLTIPQGTSVIITNQQGKWYQTTYNNKTGWVSSTYVKITETFRQGEINAVGGLNLRANASTSGNVQMIIPNGANIPIIEESNNWYKTIYQGVNGWVLAEYVVVLNADDTKTIDLAPNGKVFILGGSGVISAINENILQGKAASRYEDNLKTFPTLPSSLNNPVSEQPYDPQGEALLDPFAGVTSNNLNGKKIVIDPGHGGRDPGTSGANKTYEKFVNLAVATYLNDILAQAGATVVMTRTTDVSVYPDYSTITQDLQARVELANNEDPDLFISIHNNWNSNSDMKGSTTYYSLDNPSQTECSILAQAMQNSLTETLETENKGVRTENYYVLKYTNVPAVLLEIAFMSNTYEEARLQNPVFQKKVATAVFHGLIRYFQSVDP